MNLVFVEGGNKIYKEIAHRTVAFCIDKLLPRHKNLEIHVQLKSIRTDATGYALMGDTRNDYEIEIEKDQTIREFITTICHEMVHVKQYAKKEMDPITNDEGNYRWKREVISGKTLYNELPWEKEAYDLQETLVEEIWQKGIV